MTKHSKHFGFELPSKEEEARINAAIATDPDTFSPTDEQLAKMRPRAGRPVGSGKKTQVTLRLDTDLLEQFKATGTGWQTRLNEALRAGAKRLKLQ